MGVESGGVPSASLRTGSAGITERLESACGIQPSAAGSKVRSMDSMWSMPVMRRTSSAAYEPAQLVFGEGGFAEAWKRACN